MVRVLDEKTAAVAMAAMCESGKLNYILLFVGIHTVQIVSWTVLNSDINKVVSEVTAMRWWTVILK